jgi:hypothetical protein
MSDALDKAKAAVEHAAALMEDVSWDCEVLPRGVLRLLDVARVQATIAQAEAMEKIADRLDTGVATVAVVRQR